MVDPVKTSNPDSTAGAAVREEESTAAGHPAQADDLETRARRLAESQAGVRRGEFLPPITGDLKAYRDLLKQATGRLRNAGEQYLPAA
ncbi:MAG TPA: hypothetical protein VF498_10625, partial [Anaerolineales bacterium]